ncbi:hypothetical protein N7491_004595 [Penicillium cf. griseofulvum]|nr:hypothetical protein N7491_004595 [Penicillium cf. griseofulvum]
MSDPISVAGTAVGIISLGLQVCGEIVSFCQAWQGFNDDIQNIGQKADGLRMPLRALRRLIEDFRTTDPTIATDLEQKAKSIEQAIKRLKTATDRYSSTASDTDSFRFQLKKAAYPFRKEGLRDMASDLDSVQGVLDTALLIRMLNFAIRASFSLSKGAGGYSIAPLLHLQPLLDAANSVGYRIISDFGTELDSKPTEHELSVNRTIQQLQRAFDLQEATPFDLIWRRGSRLLDLDCSFTFSAPNSLARRQGIQHQLFHSDEFQIPNIARILLQESEDELRDALDSGTASPNDMIGRSTLFDYAFGWPKGIQILLEAGAKPSAEIQTIPYVEDNNNEDTYHSVKLLIEAGSSFDWYDIEACETKGSENIKSLLISELVARQKSLWHLAQCCLPAGQLPNLISVDEKTGEITILDVHTAEIHARLVKKGISIDTIRQCGCFDDWIHSGSVYHYDYFSAKTLKELYQVGFRGVTQLDSRGDTPLMAAKHTLFSEIDGMERMDWLVLRGDDPYEEVTGTSSTATHHLGLAIGDYFLRGRLSLPEFEVWKQAVSKFGKTFFLLPSVRDRCSCACSPSGCTTMSVFLRHIVDRLYSMPLRGGEPSYVFRELIKFLLWWTRGDTEIGSKVIRFLTFDALGLKHSCCINISFGPWRMFKLVDREEEEVEEIRDEEKSRILELEKLLAELEIKFDDLGQPLMEFLEGYWHTRMIEVLSQRDPYDEEHVIESRQIGVTLEPDECVVPDRVSLLIGSKIKSEIST